MRSDLFPRLNPVLLAIGLVVLSACGGGSSGGGGGTTTSTTTTTTLFPANAVLTGVAASGAPLLSSSVKVVDASGTLAGTGTTSPADGAYRLVLPATPPQLPLFIQVTGVDAAGTPVVLHSLLQTGTLPLVANITPATNAVVAQVLGADPKTVFLNAAGSASSIALLGNSAAVTNASNLVKTIIKINLADGKIADPTKLDFFQDATFAANKTGLDFSLEGLRIQIGKDGSGKDILQFSNKFTALGSAEVTLDLATAKAELAKDTGGNVANAITSTGKATTSPTSILTNLGVLDDLSTALNKLIAQGTSATTFQASTLIAPAPASATTTSTTPAYGFHNGRSRTDLTNKLAGFAAKNYQLSKFQVTGCADYPVTSKCTKVSVSALVMDATGQRVDVFSDAVTYSKVWMLVGNGFTSDLSVYPAAYAIYGLNGALATSPATNPGYGVQVVINLATGDTASRIVQIPSGYSIPFANCNLGYLCVKTSATANPVASGELKDTLPQQLTQGTIGNLDAAAGAKYLVSVSGVTPIVLSPAYLPAAVTSDLGNAPFPMLDAITSKPLAIADITASAGLTLSWADWAAANPNMRMFLARTLVTSASSYVYSDAAVPLASGTGIKIPALSIPSGFTATSYQVWLGAQDNQGRRYYSKFASAP